MKDGKLEDKIQISKMGVRWINTYNIKEFLQICEDICNLHNIKGKECWARIKERAGKSLLESKE